MAIETNEAVKALVAFGPATVGLYLFPLSQKPTYLKRFLVLEMSRNVGLGDNDENTTYVRRLADALNSASLVNPTIIADRVSA